MQRLGAELDAWPWLQPQWRIQVRQLSRNLCLDRLVTYLLSYIRLACTDLVLLGKGMVYLGIICVE